jgi:hypothetical protein
MWVDGQCHNPLRFTPAKRPGNHITGSCVDTGTSLDGCGHRHQPRWVWKISPLPGVRSRTVHPVSSCYNDYAVAAHKNKWNNIEF